MRKNSQKGFTLVELTIVILLIGVVAAFIIPAVSNKETSTQIKATNTVKGYIAEYKSNHSTDHVDDVTLIHSEDNTLYIYGYNFDEDVLYVFTGALWLTRAQGNMMSSSFANAAGYIISSANGVGSGEVDQYPEARGIFTGNTNLKNEFSARTQKKMQPDTVFLHAVINKNYLAPDSSIEYKFVRADGLKGDNVATATYTTVFKDSNGDTLYTFSTADNASFTCPADPTKTGKQFLYWNLINVNDEDKDIPALALVPGEEYDVPNSNVIYKAVYDEDAVPQREGGVYQLYGAKHLKWFVDHVNDTETNYSGANAILVRSFNVGTLSTSIGTSTRPYHGTFDGNGKTIMNLTVTAGASRTHTALFGYVNGATIKDLTLKNPTITGNTYVSALVAEAIATVNSSYGMTAADTDIYSTAVTKIQNCAVVDAVITCSSVQAADDVSTSEQVEALAETSIFRDRYEIQNIDAGEGPVATVVLTQKEQGTYCGGLVGFGENVEITGCTVSGTIAGGNNGVAVGGIIGCAQGVHVIVGNSADHSKLGAGCDAVVSGVRYVGGIIGKTQDSDAVTAKLASLATPKTVTTGVEIYNSYLTGEVTRSTSVMKLPEESYLAETYTNYCIGFGGIVGGTRNSFLTIEDCDTAGTAKVDPSVSNEHNYTSTYVGGILGYAEEGQISIDSTVNKCAVAGRQSTGGIVGAVRDVKISVNECENNGAVVSRTLCAGGIVGYIKTTQTDTRAIPSIQIVNSTNKGTVTSEKRVGGILGEVERIASVTGCTNTAAVSETTTSAQDGGCGGIVGYSVGRLTVANCTNSGAVTSAKQSAGGTIGRMTSYTTVKTSRVPTLYDLDPEHYLEEVPEDVTLSSNGSTITGCTNSGAVTAPKRAGGILGDALRTATLTDCTNTGAITENFADLTALTTDTGCGGIAGYTTAALTITGCTNEGIITSYCQGAGGIVGKATSVTLLKSNSALTVFEKAGLADADPTAEPPVEEGTLTLTAADTAITNCINKGMVENAPAAAEDIVAVTEPLNPGDPSPVYPYRYAGGIAGYADEPITIEVCINASYVAGQTYVGGIAGALVKKDGALQQSAVRRCMSVGIVEARNAAEAKAGAIIGTNEWGLNFSYNVYLNDMVQKKNVTSFTVIKSTTEVEPRNYGSHYQASSFTQADKALSTLNKLGDGTLETPVYQLPDNSDPLNPAVFTYDDTLTGENGAVAAYAALEPSVTITLPTFIPEFYVAPAEP